MDDEDEPPAKPKGKRKSSTPPPDPIATAMSNIAAQALQANTLAAETQQRTAIEVEKIRSEAMMAMLKPQEGLAEAIGTRLAGAVQQMGAQQTEAMERSMDKFAGKIAEQLAKLMKK